MRERFRELRRQQAQPLIARRYAFVDPADNPGRVRNYWGMPPGLSSGNGERIEMPNASLVIIASAGANAFVLGYAADGSALADSWGATLDEAHRHAAWEFGESIEWIDVPGEVEVRDLIARVLPPPG